VCCVCVCVCVCVATSICLLCLVHVVKSSQWRTGLKCTRRQILLVAKIACGCRLYVARKCSQRHKYALIHTRHTLAHRSVGMPGMPPGMDFSKIMSDPEIMAAMQNPKMMQVRDEREVQVEIIAGRENRVVRVFVLLSLSLSR
jgi:hypothetical protein